MTDAEKLDRAIRSLARIANCVCFRVMTGEWPEGSPCPDCVCVTCDARGTLQSMGLLIPDGAYGEIVPPYGSEIKEGR
jgi:hypothetical protein